MSETVLYHEGRIRGVPHEPNMVGVLLEKFISDMEGRLDSGVIYVLSYYVSGEPTQARSGDYTRFPTVKENGRLILPVPELQPDPDAFAIREAIRFTDELLAKYQPEKLS